MAATTRESDAERSQREYDLDTKFLNHFNGKYRNLENFPWYMQYVIPEGAKTISENRTPSPHNQSLETRLQTCEYNLENMKHAKTYLSDLRKSLILLKERDALPDVERGLIANAQTEIIKATEELKEATRSIHNKKTRHEIEDKITNRHHFIDWLDEKHRPQMFQDAIDDTNRKLEKVEAMIAVRTPICQGVRLIVDASNLGHTEGQKRGYM